ncbi:MAG: DNA mismatch repair protein MutS [Candidatus Melainabacteria bacterium]|nr:DNA mismatch repair protein MutS [Candidatus Melainabacteria bacterium]
MTSLTAANTAYQTLHSFQVDAAQATPMVRQFLEVKRQYPGVMLLYRMGDFYETFFEDAITAARLLEITLTGRDAGSLGRIPMAGVPAKAVDQYTARLLEHRLKVAICDQMEDPAQAKGLVARQVTRVLSPGTVTESALLKSDRNNYMAAVVLGPVEADPGKAGPAKVQRAGLAYCDVSTGEFWVTDVEMSQLSGELARIQPAELLVPGRLHRPPGQPVAELLPDVPTCLTESYSCTPLPPAAYEDRHTHRLLLSMFRVSSLEGYGLGWEASLILRAAGAIAHYLKETFLETLPAFDRIQRYFLNDTVAMSPTVRKNLELLSTVKDDRYEGSLLSVLNQTHTSMGSRLLRQWVSQPLTHLPEIESRLDAIEELLHSGGDSGAYSAKDSGKDIVQNIGQNSVQQYSAQPRQQLAELLPAVYDLERLSVRLASANVSPRDLLALKISLQKLPQIAQCMQSFKSFHLLRVQAFPPEIVQVVGLIERALSDTPPVNLKEGGVIRAGYHPELDRLRQLLEGQVQWLAEYEESLRLETGLRSLKVNHNQAFGFYIEISRVQARQVPETFHRKQTLTNAERFTTDRLKTYEAEVMDAQSRVLSLEQNLFSELRSQLQPYAALVKECAHRVAVLDVLQSLAQVADDRQYVRPKLDESKSLHLENVRHPVVETMLPVGRFVPNACSLAHGAESDAPQLMIITGPNMAGKSTYMRQVALAVVLAQMGSFVPATYARMGLVDGIYTRIGAVDDLAAGQSTFMVEMNETAQILNNATDRSLVILDEVGRGTSTYDGVAIAWSVAEFLVSNVGARTLFATHYHELNALEAVYPGHIRNFRVCVTESDDEIEFLHTVEPGAAQKSYGIQVARMAGVPALVTQRATARLNALQKKASAILEVNKAALTEASPQLRLF